MSELNYCKVKNCRFSKSHTTKSHKCGNCHSYGHGEIECDTQIARINLKQYWTDQLPKELYCTFGGCLHYKYHTSDSHHCEFCNNRYHSKNTCPLNILPNIMEINCPICKQSNIIQENQKKIFGLTDICAVCLNHNVEVFLPQCGHVCLCVNCSKLLDKKIIINNNIDTNSYDGIRNESILQSQLYDLATVKSYLKQYPSYVVVYEGMGCCTYIRRLNSNSTLEGLFIHSDDVYDPNKILQNNEFINGYCEIRVNPMLIQPINI